MSQATSTYWDERVERVERIPVSIKVTPAVRRRARVRRLTDGIILTIMLAAGATCLSAYSRASAELSAVLVRHEAAGERVNDLTIRVQKLEHDVEQLRTDSRVIEQFARQKFGFVRAGEVVIKLPQESKAVATTTPEEHSVKVTNLTPRTSDGYTDASN